MCVAVSRSAQRAMTGTSGAKQVHRLHHAEIDLVVIGQRQYRPD